LAGDDIRVYFNCIAHLHSTTGIMGTLFIAAGTGTLTGDRRSLHHEVSTHISSLSTRGKWFSVSGAERVQTTSTCARKGFRIPLASVEKIAKCAGGIPVILVI
jgi:hypothetical protein